MYHMDDMDYYALLDIERSSPPEEITRAFRHLVREYHPDLHPGDMEADKRFKKINEAYQTLSDPEKRMLYDQQFADPQPAEQFPSSSTANDYGEHPYIERQAAVMLGENIEGIVGEVAATFEVLANEAADEMRKVLLDFGAELDSMSQILHSTMGNRKMRRNFSSPPPQNRKSPPDGRP